MNFPEDLKARRQWLVWKFVQKDNTPKPSKIPYYVNGQPRTGGQGSDSDRAELVDYETAAERVALSDGNYSGVGFAFLPGDGLIGIDIDAVCPPEKQQSIVSACQTFAERSPSGNGVHIIGYGETQSFKSNDIGIEVFCGRQFFTMTGDNIRPDIATIPVEAITKLRRTVDRAKEAKRGSKPAQPPAAAPVTNSAKVESALAYISPDCGYEDWIRVGMAIHAELGEGAMSVWDHWSSRGSSYKGGKDIESHWRSFRPGPVTGATLFKMAVDGGWQPPRQQRQPAQAPAPATNVDPETGEILDAPAPAAEPANDNAPPDFGTPIDVFGLKQPPELPIELLPDAFRAYVQDQAELTGCDPAIIGMGAVVAAAACITDRIKIQPKAKDVTWHEHPRLWVAFVGDPSTKKSPAIGKAVRHVKRIDHRMSEENASAMGDWKWQHDSWKEAKKADKSGALPPEPKMPGQKRILVEDITVEKLSDVLKDNPRGVLTLKDELTGWFAGMDAYKGGGKGANMDRAHWLETYNGGPRTIDRVARGTVSIPNWSVCIIGGIQPDMIRSISASMGNDGLLQRFMVIVARPAVLDEDRTPDMDAMHRFSELFDQLAALEGGPKSILMSHAAQESRVRVSAYARRLIAAFDSPHMKAWLGKWDGLFGRLAITYHTIECAAQRVHPGERDVSGHTAAMVERLMCGYLLHHAIHFYSEILDSHDRQEHVRQICRLILARRFERITKRDIMLYWKPGGKMDWWQVRAIIDVLCTMAWLDPDESAIDTDGRPRAWHVNPQVHEMFAAHAERERDRRRAASETLREIWGAYGKAN